MPKTNKIICAALTITGVLSIALYACWKLNLKKSYQAWKKDSRIKKEIAKIMPIKFKQNGFILTQESFKDIISIPFKIINLSDFWKADTNKAERLASLSQDKPKYILLAIDKAAKEQQFTTKLISRVLQQLKIEEKSFELSWEVHVKTHHLNLVADESCFRNIPMPTMKLTKDSIEKIEYFINNDAAAKAIVDGVVSEYLKQSAHESQKLYLLKKQVIDDLLMDKYSIHLMQFYKMAQLYKITPQSSLPL